MAALFGYIQLVGYSIHCNVLAPFSVSAFADYSHEQSARRKQRQQHRQPIAEAGIQRGLVQQRHIGGGGERIRLAGEIEAPVGAINPEMPELPQRMMLRRFSIARIAAI